jgi:hypothetical protein
MSRMKRLVSIFMVVVLVVLTSVTASAAEKKVTIEQSKDGYMVVSGYDSEVKPGVFLASQPVTITFYGTDLTCENANLLPKATYDKTTGNVKPNTGLDNIDLDNIDLDKIAETIVPIPLNVEKFVANGCYAAENYVTLTGSGIYNVFAGPEAFGATQIYIIMTSIPVTATPTSSAVTVNGNKINFDAYLINGNNYFKLRDIAMALKDTNKKFSVDWMLGSINVLSGETYKPVGGELTVGSKTIKSAELTSSPLFINNKKMNLTSYNIGGNNYFKLRDIGQALGFGVTWDGSSNTIVIDTTKSYTAEGSSTTSKTEGGSIGITGSTVPIANMLQDWPRGVSVSSVTFGGPADIAGIKANDVILYLDGEPVESTEGLKEILDSYEPGDKVELIIFRPNYEYELLGASVILGSASDGFADNLS